MTAAAEPTSNDQQLSLNRGWVRGVRPARRARPAGEGKLLCAGCRSREARYGFRDPDRQEGKESRPSTLCFECFRMEIARRQAVAARLARGWNAEQARLPLEETLRALTLRRRRAQIAARRAVGE